MNEDVGSKAEQPADALNFHNRSMLDATPRAMEMLKESKTAQVAMASMVNGWRVYMAAKELLDSALMAQAGTEDSSDIADYARVVIESARHNAMQTFRIEDLIQELESGTIPMLRIRQGQLGTEEDVQRERVLLEAEQQRKLAPVPVGIPFSADLDASIPKGKTVTLLGSTAGVRHVTGLMSQGAIKAPLEMGTLRSNNVLWLSLGESPYKDTQLRVVPFKSWAGKAESRGRLEDFIGELIEKDLKGRCDLIIVDNIASLMAGKNWPDTKSKVDVAASKANVRMQRVAGSHYSALLAGLCGEGIDADTEITLEEHTHLIRIQQEQLDDERIAFRVGDAYDFVLSLEADEETTTETDDEQESD